jgi:phage shock protein B
MDGIIVAFFVPTVLFLCFVAPIWIFMHYRSKQTSQGALSEGERVELETLAAQAERMIQRIETLEAILDNETPGWRNRMRSEYSHE